MSSHANPVMKPRGRDMARLRAILEEARDTKQPRCAEWLWDQIIELLEQAQERVEAGLWGNAQERLRVAAKKEREARNVDIVEKYQAVFDELKKLYEEAAQVRKSIPAKLIQAAIKPEDPVFLVSSMTPAQETEAIALIKEEDEEEASIPFEECSPEPVPYREEPAPKKTKKIETTPDHPWVVATKKAGLIKAYWAALISRKEENILLATKACKEVGLSEVYTETLWQLENRPLESPHRVARLVAKDAWEMIP
jgi:hypothetical protein